MNEKATNGLIEAHIHILPGIDDGSDSVETSMAMLRTLISQGVTEIIATPHYYHHREKSLEHYLDKRQRAFEKLQAAMKAENIDIPFRLGAEVSIERGISEVSGIEKLAYTNSDVILLEFPYDRYQPWMEDEIYNISSAYQLKVIIAHIHRYLTLFTAKDLDHALSMDVIFQVNNEAFGSFREKRFVQKLLKEEYPIIFGSDSHNVGERKPNWDLLLKKCKAEYIENGMSLLREHLN